MNLLDVLNALAILIGFVAMVKPRIFPMLRDKDTEKPSLGRVGQFVALVTSTWGFVWMALHDRLTEWYVTAYMFAWAGAQFGSIWLKIKGQKERPSC